MALPLIVRRGVVVIVVKRPHHGALRHRGRQTSALVGSRRAFCNTLGMMSHGGFIQHIRPLQLT
jgi:hypothetical protein